MISITWTIAGRNHSVTTDDYLTAGQIGANISLLGCDVIVRSADHPDTEYRWADGRMLIRDRRSQS